MILILGIDFSYKICPTNRLHNRRYCSARWNWRYTREGYFFHFPGDLSFRINTDKNRTNRQSTYNISGLTWSFICCNKHVQQKPLKFGKAFIRRLQNRTDVISLALYKRIFREDEIWHTLSCKCCYRNHLVCGFNLLSALVFSQKASCPFLFDNGILDAWKECSACPVFVDKTVHCSQT